MVVFDFVIHSTFATARHIWGALSAAWIADVPLVTAWRLRPKPRVSTALRVRRYNSSVQFSAPGLGLGWSSRNWRKLSRFLRYTVHALPTRSFQPLNTPTAHVGGRGDETGLWGR